jgi:hypothetical protein
MVSGVFVFLVFDSNNRTLCLESPPRPVSVVPRYTCGAHAPGKLNDLLLLSGAG